RVAIGEFGGLAENADGPRLLLPFQDAVVRDVAPKEMAAVAAPAQPLPPPRAAPEPLDRRAEDTVRRKGRIKDLDRSVRIAQARLPHAAFLPVQRMSRAVSGEDCGDFVSQAPLRLNARSRRRASPLSTARSLGCAN